MAPKGKTHGVYGAPKMGEGFSAPLTTLMLRRLPPEMTTDTLLAMLNIVTPGRFDFVYVPYDRHKLVNISLAFINFTDSRAAKEAQEFFHLLNDAHAAWNIVACAGNVQGFSFNAAYYVARFGIRAIHDAHAPVLFKNGMQLTDRMEISRLYASLPTSTLQGAKDFVKAERGGSSQRGTARRAHDLIWQPTESRLPAGPDYGWSDSHKQLRDNVKAMMPAGLAPANSVFSSPPSTRSPSSEPDGLKLSESTSLVGTLLPVSFRGFPF